MTFDKNATAEEAAVDGRMHTLAAHGATTLFVLLWSGGAIFSRWGLAHASPFAFLTLRFVIALAVLVAIGLVRRRLLPARGTRCRVAMTGLLMIGGYSICYLLALDHGMTPGVLATVLGVQPILTLLWMERRVSVGRLAGLGLALGGLAMIVANSLLAAKLSAAGLLCALAALASMTVGAILQKRIRQAPVEILPLQYTVALGMCLLCLPFQPFTFERTLGFLIPLLWMGLVISVVATLLFYRLIRAGNLVNVTSLFYLVPPGTAMLDYLVLGNRLAPSSLLGMAGVLGGLALVFRAEKDRQRQSASAG
ncbi:Permease of the drug/metabolite transporter (DMT) superfamily [Cupriavidus sp. YR651]|uniref:DMT family transporter n=1 Tax=Cupriavidus sp. YR651 TaxID=1855315 RepID=UPI000882BCE7|nr:DMT family transporter [Cupriavidus sp. YR651]SDD34344.1 Permease of the drug/metabolite transporter (DMT) superfamily [Cupriavidus sp. YR651]